jgi:hypothetical protein
VSAPLRSITPDGRTEALESELMSNESRFNPTPAPAHTHAEEHTMRRSRCTRTLAALLCICGIAAVHAPIASAHCDGLDGPVVMAAKEALAQGDANRVIIWVRKSDEPAIREAFERTMNVRKLNPQARELADTYFFETLVRIHRSGEGAPYTGLKPAGRDLGPAIPAADRALQSGDATALSDLLVDQMRAGLSERFKHAKAAKSFKADDVDAGREYVEAYVSYIHYVEGVYEAAESSASGHYPERTTARHDEP